MARTDVDGAAGTRAVELATAVITAEAFGGLLGRAGGAVITTLVDATVGTHATGLLVAYAAFAAVVAAAAVAVVRVPVTGSVQPGTSSSAEPSRRTQPHSRSPGPDVGGGAVGGCIRAGQRS